MKLIIGLGVQFFSKFFNHLLALAVIADTILVHFKFVFFISKFAFEFCNFLCPLLLFIIKNRQVFTLRSKLKPLNSVPLHYICKDFFFGLYPLTPLCFFTATTLETLHSQRLFQRYPCVQSTLTACHKGEKIYMQVGRFFIQMQVSREHSKLGISLYKSAIILIQNFSCEFTMLPLNIGIILISNLHNNLVEQFFLLARAYFFIIIIYLSVGSCLLIVVSFHGIIKEFVIYPADIFITITDIVLCAFGIHI